MWGVIARVLCTKTLQHASFKYIDTNVINDTIYKYPQRKNSNLL